MIALQTIDEQWEQSDFFDWIESYRTLFPKNAKRVLIQLSHPFHQIAAMCAALTLDKTVLLVASTESDDALKLKRNLFLPEYELNIIAKEKLSDQGNFDLQISNGMLAVTTSGSSGRPKIVLIEQQALLASAKATLDFYQTSKGDIIASPLPLYHVGGIMPFWRALLNQSTLVLPSHHWFDLFKLKPKQVSLVPTQLQYLLDHSHHWQDQNCVILGAQALPRPLFEQASQAGVPISVSYGSSESVAQLSATPVGVDPLDSVGVLLPSRQVSIIDGRLAFKGDACFSAYQDGMTITEPFNDEGYFLTQDMASFDSQGQLYIHGRADHIYKSGGKNINPQELERLIESKIQVPCLITPLEDHDFSHITGAFLKSKPLSIEAIKELNQLLNTEEKLRHVRYDLPSNQSIKDSRLKAQEYLQNKLRPWNLGRLSPRNHHKRDLVFLHGFMGSKASLAKLAAPFAKHFNIWSLDLPFHGTHQDCDYQSWDNMIDELAFVLMRFSKLSIYGYSMGGRVALGLKLRHPELIDHLILEGAHPGLKSEQEKIERRQWEQELSHKMDNFPQFLRNWYQAPLFNLKPEEIEELIAITPSLSQSYARALELYGLSKQPDCSTQIDHDIIYLAGEHDHKYRAIHPKPLIIPDAGHKASFQFPELTSALILSDIARRGWH